MARYYRLASTDLIPGFQTKPPYPYSAYLCFEHVSKAASVEIGQGHYYSGGVTSLDGLLGMGGFLAECQGDWLVPYMKRMLRGERVEDAVLDEYRRRHGHEPKHEDLGNT
jgi:hypothetical protein